MKEQLIQISKTITDLMQELVNLEDETTDNELAANNIMDATGFLSDAQHHVDTAIKNITE